VALPVPGHSLPVLPLLHTHPQVLEPYRTLRFVSCTVLLLKITGTLAKHTLQCTCIVGIRVDTLLICHSTVMIPNLSYR
jgi:hypothetical protein